MIQFILNCTFFKVYPALPIVGDRLHLVNSETVVTQLKSAHYHGDLSPALHQATDLVAGFLSIIEVFYFLFKMYLPIFH